MFIFEQFIDFFINSQQNHSLKYIRCKGKDLHTLLNLKSERKNWSVNQACLSV